MGVAALAAIPASAATFTVTNLNDTGPGSLRDAIATANATALPDVVTFQPGLTGTITLTTGQLEITDSVDIQGPGATVLSVSGNDASRVFYLYNGSALLDVSISNLTVTHGDDSIGGGIVDFDENLVLDGVTITDNHTSDDGAGLWADGFSMQLTVRNTIISGNVSDEDGGGIYVEDTGAPMLIEDTVITGNQAAVSGGGIYFYDPDDNITIRDTTISGNTAGAIGGGIYLYSFDNGAMTIEGSTISGNSAAAGGGLFFYGVDHDTTLIENSTISGNQATAGDGGGIYLYEAYTPLHLNFVTIANNTAAGSGGGMFTNLGTPEFFNSIVADNTAATDNDLGAGQDASFDLSYTLLETATGANISDLTGNLLDTDPQLGTLGNNGGQTQTQRPALTSPVINAADPVVVTPATDQRGQPRVTGGRADMGAVELNGGTIQFNPIAYPVAENAGSVTLTIVRDVAVDPATVDYATSAGTATAADFTGVAGTANFAPGELSKTFPVTILEDALVEGAEVFTATLSNPSPAAALGAGNPATVTITDFEEGQVVFSSPTYSVGEQGASLLITVNRINGTDGPASVNYTTVAGSATAGADYTTTFGTLTWLAGDAAPKTFSIPILDDSLAEGSETLTVSLNTPVGVTVGAPGAATVTITDDPAGTAQFSVSSIDTAEGVGSVLVTVTRTGGTEGALSANYTSANGTAVAPGDYTTTNGTVTFPAGSATPQTFSVPIVDDATVEPQETFTMTLTGASVSSPSTLAINIAPSDTVPVPALSLFGKLLLGILSGVAGLYAILRSRLSVLLVGLLLTGLVTPALHAAMPPRSHKTAAAKVAGEKKKEGKSGKLRGTLESASSDGTTLTIHLTSGETVTLPAKQVKIVDSRPGHKHTAGVAQLVAGTHVVIKPARTGHAHGHARIRIMQ